MLNFLVGMCGCKDMLRGVAKIFDTYVRVRGIVSAHTYTHRYPPEVYPLYTLGVPPITLHTSGYAASGSL